MAFTKGNPIDPLSVVAAAYREGKKSLVSFRKLFLPIPNEVKTPWFHEVWSDILLNGTAHYAIEGFRESAKALSLDTIVPTPKGDKTISDISVGDFVFDENGQPIEVIETSPVFTGHPCFKVTFDDGAFVIADSEHLWTVLDKHKRRVNIVTTLQMAGSYKLGAERNGYQEFAYRIPVAPAVNYEKKELPLHPYLLGYWLGDGKTTGASIFVGDQDKEEAVKIFKTLYNPEFIGERKDKTCWDIKFTNGFRKCLLDLDLIGNKRIPLNYLEADIESRKELIGGLIDSDGHVTNKGTKRGTVTIVQKNAELSLDIWKLACSLGYKATMTESRAKVNGKDCGLVYKIAFKTTDRLCRLKRKAVAFEANQDNRSLMRSIINVEPVESVQTKCIKVKSLTGLFLVTKHNIITHNTGIVLRAFPLHCLVYPEDNKSYIVFVMANQKAASKRLKEIADEYVNNPLFNLNLVKVKEQSEKAFEVIVKNEKGEEKLVRFEAYGKGSGIRGLNSHDKRPDIVLIDDPQDLEDSLSDTIQSNDYDWFISDVFFLGQYTRIFFIGNNLGEKCLIEQIITNKDSLKFEAIRIPILDAEGNSNWPERWSVEDIEQQKEDFRKIGKLDLWVREKMCLAISPDSQIFKKEYFKYYEPSELKTEGFSVYTTVDLAISEKATADYSVVCTVGVNQDNHWFLLDLKFGRWNPSQLMDKIFETVAQFKPIYVGLEKVAYQAALIHFVQKEMPKRNQWFTVKELLAEKKKELRIQALQPRFVSGTVWFPMGAKFLTELESELLAFPRSLHDDLLDALAYVDQIALPPANSFTAVATDEIPYAGAM